MLHAALTLHPDAAAKMGARITHFSVRSADFGSKCFWVNRVDGTTEKFSYKACAGVRKREHSEQQWS
ncbi:MAG: DCL family protein [Xanthobacteraceae bacterium]